MSSQSELAILTSKSVQKDILGKDASSFLLCSDYSTHIGRKANSYFFFEVNLWYLVYLAAKAKKRLYVYSDMPISRAI